MQTAYTNAAGRPAGVTELGSGNIGGLTLVPGVYKWGTGVTIPTDVTLAGGKNDVWIFQIAGTLKISSAKKVILKSGALAQNIFWQVAGATTLGTNSTFNGNILDKTKIALQTGAVLNGSALAQTAVTLDANKVTGIVVTPGAARTLAVSGIPSPYVAGVAHSVTVTALDAYGNVATGYRGTVTFTSTDAKATLPANYKFTAADSGVHRFSLGVTLKTAGTQAIRARDTVTSTITGLQSGIIVTAAAATTLTVSGLASPRTAGVAGTITVTAHDAYGNVATGYRGTVTFTSTDSHALLPANYTFTAANAGTHTFSVTLKTAGTQAVRARDTVTTTITGLESGIVVS
jgi:hypothetical protein